MTSAARVRDAMVEHLRNYVKPEPALVATLDTLLAEIERLQAKLAEYDKYVGEFTNNA